MMEVEKERQIQRMKLWSEVVREACNEQQFAAADRFLTEFDKRFPSIP